jgi:hypothetical protein
LNEIEYLAERYGVVKISYSKTFSIQIIDIDNNILYNNFFMYEDWKNDLELF